MKNHCKAIAIIGMILILYVTGIRIYELTNVLNVDNSNTKLALTWLAEGGAVAYVIYVMWSAFAEMLSRIEETYSKASRSLSELERMEKEIKELTKSVHERVPSTEEINEIKYRDFGGKETDRSKRDESDSNKVENRLSGNRKEKAQTVLEEQVLQPVLFCPSCGKKIEKDAKFCRGCGAKIG